MSEKPIFKTFTLLLLLNTWNSKAREQQCEDSEVHDKGEAQGLCRAEQMPEKGVLGKLQTSYSWTCVLPAHPLGWVRQPDDFAH